MLMSVSEIDGAATAAGMVVDIHRHLAEWLRAGQTLAQIDTFVAKALDDLGAKSAFLGYRTGRYPRFPSYACLSPNDVVVHGTAGMSLEPMKSGDLISIDIGVKYRGWIGDAAWTYVFEHADETVQRLCDCGRRSIQLGIAQLQPCTPLLRWAEAIERYVEDECGFRLVRGLGGHGYGQKLHTPPFVSNVTPRTRTEWPDSTYELKPGDLLAVEPMLAEGSAELEQQPRQWPISTADGGRAVHYEHDVLITDDGPRVLTAGLDELPTIVGG